MSLKYTKMPTDAFERLQLNAGILVDDFNPTTGQIGTILGATSGGIAFATNPTYNDFGEDVDNCPPNTKQLKHVSYYDPSMSGTFLTVSPDMIASQIGGADVDGTHVTPRAYLLETDFHDLWWIGDYSDVNTGADAGYLAIHLMDALNTTGFQIQSGKDAKGVMAFEYHGHYDLEDEEQSPPFEIYCKQGEDSAGVPAVTLNTHYITLAVNGTYTLRANVRNSSEDVTWSTGSGTIATVDGGVVTGAAAGDTIITVTLEDDGVEYTDTCTVVVTA